MEKKDMPVVEMGHHVIIPVGVKGGVYENATHLLDLIKKWEDDNQNKELEGAPVFNITPSSSGRGVTIDSINFIWKQRSLSGGKY